jgi:Na+-translocating ferredoxin:NAD+ oxidoreductase RnfG subunit
VIPKHPGWSVLPVAALAIPAPAWAVQYLTAEQAMRLAFPAADTFKSVRVSLPAARWQAIDRDAPALVAVREPRAWVASADGAELGRVYVDEVLGKQLFITYAVAIGSDGQVGRVEILEYRETHGFEVRNARWLRQFTGTTARSSLEFGVDIKNISGATLSCRHVTDGVRRLLAVDRAIRED